jgi:hypothetical protein
MQVNRFRTKLCIILLYEILHIHTRIGYATSLDYFLVLTSIIILIQVEQTSWET